MDVNIILKNSVRRRALFGGQIINTEALSATVLSHKSDSTSVIKIILLTLGWHYLIQNFPSLSVGLIAFRR